MFYLFLLGIAALGTVIYLLFFFNNVPGAIEERLGVLEPLPPNVGQWQDDSTSEAAGVAATQGLRREIRTFHDEGRGRLLYQARYRSVGTNEIVRVEPDVAVRRRRIRQPS